MIQVTDYNKSSISLKNATFDGGIRDSQGYFKYHDRRPIKEVSTYDEIPMFLKMRDARSVDITRLSLSQEELFNMIIDETTVMTDEQKESIEQYIESCKNPGLGIRDLHSQGITGEGVKIAIIDQPLGRHKEYEENLVGKVHDINYVQTRGNLSTACMHGPSVASIAVGKNVGVAPKAKLVYYCTNNLLSDRTRFSNQPYAEAIHQILDENEKLSPKERVVAISISWGFDEFGPGYKELNNAVNRAKEQGVFIISCAISRHYGLYFHGANRNPKGDMDSPDNYEAGIFWRKKSETNPCDKDMLDKRLIVPMDKRTVANYQDGASYRYDAEGGWSWAVPWIAGMYALAKQVNFEITPQEFWDYALETSNECRNFGTGTYVGRLINPKGLIQKIK